MVKKMDRFFLKHVNCQSDGHKLQSKYLKDILNDISDVIFKEKAGLINFCDFYANWNIV